MNEPSLRPLQGALRNLLTDQPAGYTEFELIRALQSPSIALLADDCMRDSLALFQVHFVLFHALYQLRDEFLAQQKGTLQISASCIRLDNFHAGSVGVANADPLRDYYLDWNNFTKTQAEDVERLLDDFWIRLGRVGVLLEEDLIEALRCLELEAPSDLKRVRAQYRRLVMKHHPDRGGDKEKLQRINAAMSKLQRHYQSE